MFNQGTNPYQSPSSRQSPAASPIYFRGTALAMLVALWGFTWLLKYYLFAGRTLGDHQTFRSELYRQLGNPIGLIAICAFVFFEIAGPLAAERFLLRNPSEKNRPISIALKFLSFLNLSCFIFVFVYIRFFLI